MLHGMSHCRRRGPQSAFNSRTHTHPHTCTHTYLLLQHTHPHQRIHTSTLSSPQSRDCPRSRRGGDGNAVNQRVSAAITRVFRCFNRIPFRASDRGDSAAPRLSARDWVCPSVGLPNALGGQPFSVSNVVPREKKKKNICFHGNQATQDFPRGFWPLSPLFTLVFRFTCS